MSAVAFVGHAPRFRIAVSRLHLISTVRLMPTRAPRAIVAAGGNEHAVNRYGEEFADRALEPNLGDAIIRGIQTAVVGLLGVILIAAIVPATHQDAIAPSGEIAAPFHPACARWDEAASDALARLVHDRNDVAARQLGDALFRLRRARKNCGLGWLVVACQDYRAILHSAGGRGVAPVPACAAALIE